MIGNLASTADTSTRFQKQVAPTIGSRFVAEHNLTLGFQKNPRLSLFFL